MMEEEVSLLWRNLLQLDYLRKLRYLLSDDEEVETNEEYNVFLYDTVKYPPNGKPHKTIN
jgi:hypothetical protein